MHINLKLSDCRLKNGLKIQDPFYYVLRYNSKNYLIILDVLGFDTFVLRVRI
jgi:hypothetical protein